MNSEAPSDLAANLAASALDVLEKAEIRVAKMRAQLIERGVLEDAPVKAFGGRCTNAEAIADCHKLKYIKATDTVVDLTYGKGRFWKLYEHPRLVRCDLNPVRSLDFPDGLDATATGFEDRLFDVVVVDRFRTTFHPTGQSPKTHPGIIEGMHLLADMGHRIWLVSGNTPSVLAFKAVLAVSYAALMQVLA